MARPPASRVDTHPTMRTPIIGRPYPSDPSKYNNNNNNDNSNNICTKRGDHHGPRTRTRHLQLIQKVQDTVIHLEVDKEQWKITQGSKRQAKWVWSPRAKSCLRLPDTPHAQKPKTTVHAFRPETRERRRSIWRPSNDTRDVLCLEQTKMNINSYKVLHKDSASKKPFATP